MRLTVAVTGASGAILAAKLLEQLAEHEVHLIVSDAARAVLRHELGREDLPAAFRYGEDQWSSPLASSSFVADGMVIAPCSMKTWVVNEPCTTKEDFLHIETSCEFEVYIVCNWFKNVLDGCLKRIILCPNFTLCKEALIWLEKVTEISQSQSSSSSNYKISSNNLEESMYQLLKWCEKQSVNS